MNPIVDPLSLGACELGAALGRGLDAGEVVEASLARCESLLSSGNALVEVTREAFDGAQAPRGPLWGIPVVVKDMFVDGGRVPTVGSRVTPEWMTGTAEILNRLRAAGAAVVAYSNLHEWAIGTTSAVTASGPIANPRHRDAIAGGSSGGSAVALAVGAAPLAVGTDAGGSIRIPSACCGVVGLKPTLGAVPLDGFALPDGPPIDHVGPMARNVADTKLMFEVLAGRSVPEAEVTALKMGVPVAAFFADLVPEVGARYEEVLRELRKLVGSDSDVDLPGVEAAPIAVGGSLLPYVAKILHEDLERRPEAFGPETLAALTFGASLSEDDRAEADAQRRAVCAAFDAVFAEVDVLVTPTIPGPPAPADTQTVVLASGPAGPDVAYSRYNGPMNLAGVPALSVPVADDLSLTISAARGREDLVLAVGAALERALERAYADRVI